MTADPHVKSFIDRDQRAASPQSSDSQDARKPCDDEPRRL